MSDGDRFGREEGREATVFDFGWRNEPIWEEVKIMILIKNLQSCLFTKLMKKLRVE